MVDSTSNYEGEIAPGHMWSLTVQDPDLIALFDSLSQDERDQYMRDSMFKPDER